MKYEDWFNFSYLRKFKESLEDWETDTRSKERMASTL